MVTGFKITFFAADVVRLWDMAYLSADWTHLVDLIDCSSVIAPA